MYKVTLLQIVPILLLLYSTILESVEFPADWSKSITYPIFKSGSLLDSSDFRGVPLIDILNKILTGMMNNRLSAWAEVFF